MIHAIAIDDEKNALGIINEYAKRTEDLVLAGSFTDPLAALTWLTGHPEIGLVFLDIEMSKLNGLSLARQLRPGLKVALTTAHPEYALEGYELDILDYLLKPFTLQRFQRTIQKYRNHYPNEHPGATSRPVRLLSPSSDDFLFVRSEYKVIKVRLDELHVVEGAGNYVALHIGKTKLLTLQNMKAFEELLTPFRFIRVHKSYIVSLNHIDAIENNSVIVGHRAIPIGESYREGFQRFLTENAQQV